MNKTDYSGIATLKTQAFDADGNLVITDNVLDYLKQQEAKIKELQAENERLKGEFEVCGEALEHTNKVAESERRSAMKYKTENEKWNTQNKELQDYIQLANLVDCFIGLMPEHEYYESFRQDVIRALNVVKGKK
jgi:cell division septum initiation protein DivIVA